MGRFKLSASGRWVTGVMVVALCTPATAEEPKPGMPALARELIKPRMQRHGRDSGKLWDAVVHLHGATVQRIATDIAAEPAVARPLKGDTSDASLNRRIPDAFFDLQDTLKERARALASTAAGPYTATTLTESASRLMATCAQCHALFRKPPATPVEPTP